VLYTFLFAVQYRLDFLPRRDWLTSDELVRDKIFLRQAYERQKHVRLAKALLGEGRPDRAIEVLESAQRRHGDSRFLLQSLTDAYRATGRQREAEQARQRLQALLDRRLY
jgi:predicted Zn-dependent protease